MADPAQFPVEGAPPEDGPQQDVAAEGDDRRLSRLPAELPEERDPLAPDEPLSYPSAPQVGPDDFPRRQRDPTAGRLFPRDYVTTSGVHISTKPYSAIDEKGFRDIDGPRIRTRQPPPILGVIRPGAASHHHQETNSHPERANTDPQGADLPDFDPQEADIRPQGADSHHQEAERCRQGAYVDISVEHSDSSKELADYKKLYIPLGRTASWVRREAASSLQDAKNLRRGVNGGENNAEPLGTESIDTSTMVTTGMRHHRQQLEAPAPSAIVTAGTRTRMHASQVPDSPPIVTSAKAVRGRPAQAPETRQTRGNTTRIKNESSDEQRPAQKSRSGRIKDEQISPRNDDDLYGASPTRDSRAPQQPWNIAGDTRTASEILFDRQYPSRIVRRLRTWGGPINIPGLTPADRANISSVPGPRKRARVQ